MSSLLSATISPAQKDARIRISATKWKYLESIGMVKPKTSAENQRRLREAHGY